MLPKHITIKFGTDITDVLSTLVIFHTNLLQQFFKILNTSQKETFN